MCTLSLSSVSHRAADVVRSFQSEPNYCGTAQLDFNCSQANGV